MVNRTHVNQKVVWGRAVWLSLCILFLNRMVGWDFFWKHPLLNEIYVLISECLTVFFVLKFFYLYAQRGTMYISEVEVILAVALYFFIISLTTFLQDGNLRRILMNAYPVIGTLCFLECESRNRPKDLLAGLALFSYFVLYANFIDMIFVKQIWFGSPSAYTFLVGGRNQLAIILAFVLTIIAVYRETMTEKAKLNTKVFDILTWIIAIMTAVLSGSSTTMIGTAIIICLFFFKFIKQKELSINPFLFAVVYAAGWLALIVFRLQYLIADFILGFIGKDLTFSHRTIIWDKALEMISEQKIMGYGMSDSVNIFTVNHDYSGGGNSVLTTLSGHNQILQMLYYGGFALLTAFLLLFFVSCSRKRRNSKTFCLFFISVVITSIVWVSETPGEYAMFLMLGLCFYSGRFDHAIQDTSLLSAAACSGQEVCVE